MDELTRLWEEHREVPFPDDCRGEEVEGVDLIGLDSTAAGCVASFLARSGPLDRERAEVLRVCRREAEAVAGSLEGPGREHFERLARLAALVLSEVDGRDGGGPGARRGHR